MYEREIVKIIVEEKSNLILLFSDGKYRRLDINVLYKDYPQYKALEDQRIFKKFRLMANVIIKWDDNLDLVADTVYEYSEPIEYNESPTTLLLGYKLKKERIKQDISQKQLSKLTGIDQAEISKIENGSVNPSIEYIEKITSALHKRLEISIK